MSRQNEPAQEIYRGVWAVLAGLFRVPRQPPTLLAVVGEAIESFRPAPGFLAYLKFQFWILLLLFDGGLLVLWFVLLINEPLAAIGLSPVFLLVGVVPGIVAYVALNLRYDTTWYVMSDRSLRIRRGIWVIRETTVTFENVQNVELKQGPLQRHFGIADLVVQTAGGGARKPQKGQQTDPHEARVEGVADAKRIRDLIMTHVRRSRRTGLGDEGPGEERAAMAGAQWSPAHVEALRAIRRDVAALCR